MNQPNTQNSIKAMRPQYGFCFRPALGRKGCTGQILLWVSHRGATCFVARYDIDAGEWDALNASVVPPADNARRARQLGRYAVGMKRDLRRMKALVKQLDPRENYSARHIVSLWEENYSADWRTREPAIA